MSTTELLRLPNGTWIDPALVITILHHDELTIGDSTYPARVSVSVRTGYESSIGFGVECVNYEAAKDLADWLGEKCNAARKKDAPKC